MASLPHARSLLALEAEGRLRVQAAYSRSAERRQQFGSKFDFPVVGEITAILDDADIDAVLLLTPPNARLELVQALAASGKHILMEKPVERTTEAATRIVDICERANVCLGIVFQQRFRDASLALQRLLQTGEVGTISAMQLNVPWWRAQSYYDEAGRGSYARDGGGVLISQAIHSLDLMLSLLGSVEEVAAIAGTTAMHRMESEDFVGAGLRFASGAMGAIMASTAIYPGNTECLTIVGEQATAKLTGGELVVDYHDGRQDIVGEDSGSGGGADPMAFPHQWHQRLIEDFLNALLQDREPAVTGRKALQVHRLIDALMSSAQQRVHVRLKKGAVE